MSRQYSSPSPFLSRLSRRLSLCVSNVAIGLILGTATQAYAQTSPTSTQPHSEAEEDSDLITVTARHNRSIDILGNLSVVRDEELYRNLRGQLGDSLTRQAGLSTSSFTPGASRPIIRGLSGDRVAVLIDELDIVDVSSTSADHAVTIEPLTLERIEILRGPATLLFSGQASGGVINVVDNRIPRRMLTAPIELAVRGDYSTAADEKNIGGATNFRLGESLVVHADAHYRHANALRGGGFVNSPQIREGLRELADEEAEEGHTDEADELRELADSSGAIPNTQSASFSTGAGLAWFGDDAEVGISFGYIDSDYGLPIRPPMEMHAEGEEEHAAEEADAHAHASEVAVTAVRQYRVDVRGDVHLGDGLFERLTLRGGWSDYRHTEMHEESAEEHAEEEVHEDEEGTVFTAEGYDIRATLQQNDRDGWHGTSGIHYLHRSLDVVGAEAFLPAYRQRRFALFTLQEYQRGGVQLTAALRYENRNLRADSYNTAPAFERADNVFSAALGVGLEVGNGLHLDGSVSRTIRAASPEELLSDGAHVATAAYERGNRNFTNERAWGTQAAIHWQSEKAALSLTGHAQWIDNYIFADDTGMEEAGLPLFVYRQADSLLWGLELEGRAELARFGETTFDADIIVDMVRANLRGEQSGYLPRTPPTRILAGVEAHHKGLDARAEVEWVAAQNRHSTSENPTAAYTLVNLGLAWHGAIGKQAVTLSLDVNNVFDVEARRHSSYTKDFVPLAGRDFRVGLRLKF